MKRLILMFSLVVILLTGCGSKSDTNNSGNQNDTTQNSESLKVDKNLFDVTITLPASMFEGEDVNASAEEMKEEGYKEAIVNEDGSITAKMSKSKHNEMMKEMRASMIEYLEELKASEDFKSIQDVKYNEDFTKFTLEVIQDKYQGSLDGFSAIGIGMMSSMYHIYNGVSEEKRKVTIDVKNIETDEIFKTITYPDDLMDAETEE
ncbi:hypothetical protein SH2C18_36960 [Clostridium sediminicola]|uniref:hypothetical protein n=1 Tax=Clostridium sediminicola TaxID=3114879 RepID=UPI0031F244A6